MLNNHELELGGEKILKDIDPELVHLILEWIYTGTLNTTKFHRRDCVALVAAADYFQISDLTDNCVETIFFTILTVDNAAVLYQHFDALCIEPLKQAALAYCGEHFLAVSATPGFQQLSQPQLLTVIEHYRLSSSSSSNASKAPRLATSAQRN
jgi:hypothetical protein